MASTGYTFRWDDDDAVPFVPNQQDEFDFNSAYSLKQSMGKHVALEIQTHCPNLEPNITIVTILKVKNYLTSRTDAIK